MGDIPELKAWQAPLGDHVYNVNISSTKSMTGHLLAQPGRGGFGVHFRADARRGSPTNKSKTAIPRRRKN